MVGGKRWQAVVLGALALFVIVAAVGALLLSSGMGMAVGPGDRAPALSVLAPDGTSLTLEELRGKVVLLDFWSSW
jgi:cytochrome oxidase Cu insertion factor (SCO1/SenC/PrrC family)